MKLHRERGRTIGDSVKRGSQRKSPFAMPFVYLITSLKYFVGTNLRKRAAIVRLSEMLSGVNGKINRCR
jgi:hypothetical protein